jgi:hypothetical protein
VNRFIIAGLLLLLSACAAAEPARSVGSQPKRAVGPAELPRVVNLKICRVTVEPSKLRHSVPTRSAPSIAIEFLVETDGDVPVRAYGPALFVGGVEVNQSERIGPTTWRLLAFDYEHLTPGSPIKWGWMKAPASARASTRFRYKIERDPEACKSGR